MRRVLFFILFAGVYQWVGCAQFSSPTAVGFPLIRSVLLSVGTDSVILTQSGGTTDVIEGGSIDSYTVFLGSMPTADVIISIAFDGGQVAVNGSGSSPQTLTFNTGNWSMEQTVTVQAQDDALDEHDHSTTVTHAASSVDTGYNGIAIGDVIVSITDNDWWDTNWTRKRKLTFDNSGQTETLTDFPVLVILNSTRVDYGQTQNSGQDIRFLTENGTVLPHEIEEWNEASTSYVWVKPGSITGSSSTDHIWMYYGNSLAPDGQQITSVWSSNYQGVWHLNETVTDESTTGTHLDSSPQGNDGGQNNNASTTGRISGGQSFDASDDFISVPNDPSLDITGSLTLSLWVRPTEDFTVWTRFIEKSYLNSYYLGAINGQTDALCFFLNGSNVLSTPDNTITTNSWQHFAATFNDATNEVVIYKNGLSIASGSYAGAITGSSAAVTFSASGASLNYTGEMDEVRISSTARSADWIAAQMLSMTDAFVTFGGELLPP